MKVIFSSKRDDLPIKVCIFLIITVLIVGMTDCDGYNGSNGGDFVGSAQVAAGGVNSNTVGLKCDGTVVAVGHNDFGQCDVGHWTGITQVASGGGQTVGLKFDGTVVAVGNNGHGQCNVGGWRGIMQVAAGMEYTVGLRSDGSVVAVGDNYKGQCDVGGWTDIKQVAAGVWHTVGCKANGTVVAVGDNDAEQCSNVSNWTDIMQVAAGRYFTVGLKSDGTVVAVGDNYTGQCDVGNWTDIVQVAAGDAFTVGLKSDGTVVAVGYDWFGQCNVGNWTDIIQVAAGPEHTVGLKSDYTVVATGSNGWGCCYVSHWILCDGQDPSKLFAGGNGTEESPYKISDWYHLNNVRDYLNSHFILINNLDSTTAGYEELAGPTAYYGKGWVPILSGDGFTGTFDGQGYEIDDLFINRPGEWNVGLFGWIGEGARVENIGVVNASVTGKGKVGGLVGEVMNYGYVNNCHATGTMVSTYSVGGLVGYNNWNVSNSWATCTVTSNEGTAGGLVGGTIYHATVHSCSSTGNVTGISHTGGLVGNSDGTVSNSYASGTVVGITFSIGGLLGNNGGTTINCYVNCNVTGDVYVGGLVGYNHGTISDSYSTGNLVGSEKVGGLVGWNRDDTVSNSYSTGSVTGDVYVGGLVGYNEDTVTDSFWDIETSGQDTSDGGTGKTTVEMMDIDTFSEAAWPIIAVGGPGERNITYTWNIVDSTTYPFLSWQP